MKTETYPIYIPSKGRHDLRLTFAALERMGCPYHVIVEEQEYDLYRARCLPEHGATVLVLPDRCKDEYEYCDSHGRTKSSGSGPARNYAHEHSDAAYGAKRHWVVDDNIRGFCRFNKNEKNIQVLSPLFFRIMESFVDRYENISMAGPAYRMFVNARNARLPPVVFNTRLFSCNLILNSAPFRWRGRYNEDAILSLDMLKAGWCTAQFNALLQNKMATQTVKGGNTSELYRNGTWEKSDMLVRVHGDVARHSDKFGRDHHHVDYRPFRRNRLVRAPDYDARVAEAAALNLRMVERATLKDPHA